MFMPIVATDTDTCFYFCHLNDNNSILHFHNITAITLFT